MPKNVAQADCCFQEALGFLLKYRNMALLDDSNSDSNGNCDGKT